MRFPRVAPGVNRPEEILSGFWHSFGTRALVVYSILWIAIEVPANYSPASDLISIWGRIRGVYIMCIKYHDIGWEGHKYNAPCRA